MTRYRNKALALTRNSDIGYLRWQASEERTAALHAQHSRARAEHVAKADRYEERVRAIAAREAQARTLAAESS